MDRVQRRAVFRIDAHEMVMGRLRVDGYISRTGIQIYSDGTGSERREYRPPDEVFDEESLMSLRGMPVTIRHPKVFVDGENWKEHSVGFVGEVVEKADDGRHTVASIWIIDERAKELVSKGKLKELSVGYTAELEMIPGVSPDGERYDAVQRKIRGNHLALLPVGHARGGRSVALRLDSAGHAIFDDDGQDPSVTGEPMAKIKIRADGYDYVGEFTDDKVEQALERDRKAAAEKIDAAEKRVGELESKLDAAEKERDELKSKLDEATDPAKLAEAAKARQEFDAKLALVGGKDFDRDGLKTDGRDPTDIELMAAALEARGIKLDADASDARVEGRFDAEHDIAKDLAERGDAVDQARRTIHRNDPEKNRADSRSGFSIDRALRSFGG